MYNIQYVIFLRNLTHIIYQHNLLYKTIHFHVGIILCSNYIIIEAPSIRLCINKIITYYIIGINKKHDIEKVLSWMMPTQYRKLDCIGLIFFFYFELDVIFNSIRKNSLIDQNSILFFMIP